MPNGWWAASSAKDGGTTARASWCLASRRPATCLRSSAKARCPSGREPTSPRASVITTSTKTARRSSTASSATTTMARHSCRLRVRRRPTGWLHVSWPPSKRRTSSPSMRRRRRDSGSAASTIRSTCPSARPRTLSRSAAATPGKTRRPGTTKSARSLRCLAAARRSTCPRTTWTSAIFS